MLVVVNEIKRYEELRGNLVCASDNWDCLILQISPVNWAVGLGVSFIIRNEVKITIT